MLAMVEKKNIASLTSGQGKTLVREIRDGELEIIYGLLKWGFVCSPPFSYNETIEYKLIHC